MDEMQKMDLKSQAAAAQKTSLYGLDADEIKNLIEEGRFPSYRANQLLDWIYKKHISEWQEAKNLPKDFSEYLQSKFSLSLLHLQEVSESQVKESV